MIEISSTKKPKIHHSWLMEIEDEFKKPYMKNLRSFLIKEKSRGAIIFPPSDQIFTAQHGGRKGYSVLLYLVKLVDFILSNLEKSKAVLLSLIDFSKAYNRQNHNRLMTCYSDLGTPPYLLRILGSYLSNRKMIVRHNGSSSSIVDLPGGGPQGTNLGILNFLVYVNSCGMSLSHLAESMGCPPQESLQPPILPPPTYHIYEDESRPSCY